MSDKQILMADVTLFSGEIKTVKVMHVWCIDGIPERLHTVDAKYKYDEEPFWLYMLPDCK